MKFCDERIQKHLLNGGKIKRRDIDVVVSINKEKRLSCDCSKFYFLTQYDLIYDDWEIVEPEYNWDKIIEDKILCEFSDDEDCPDDEKVISILTSINKYKGFYYNSQGFYYKYCKACDLVEYNIAKDLKEYEK